MPWLHRPLSVAITLAAGIAIAPALDRWGCPGSARWVAALALVIVAARARRVVPAALAAVLAIGAARGSVVPVDRTGVDDRTLDRITGEVVGPIVTTARGSGARLETEAATIWIWTPENLVPGERIAVTGYLATPRGSRGVALPDGEAALLARGARLELTARTIERLADDPGVVARGWRVAADLQQAAVARIVDAGGDPSGNVALRGIAIGDRTDVPPELDARWRAAGIYHVLSVSGLHLAIVAWICSGLLRRLIAASPWGGRVRPARWAGPPALAIVFAYTCITGAQLATVRALIVVTIVIVAAMLDRPVRLVDALGVVAIALLAWRPADLFDPSFQLSLTAALTLALLPSTPRPPWVRSIRGLASWLSNWMKRGLVVSMWVSITTAPLTAYHFQEVAAGGAVGNLILTPIIEGLALPCSLVGVVLGWDLPIWIATWLVGLADRAAGGLAQVMPIGRVAVASPLVLAVLVGLALALASRRRRTRVDVLGWVALCLAWSLGRMPPPVEALRVTFVDVGQGDAAIVELPDGAVWLVDAGGFASARDVAAASAPGRAIGRVLAAYGHDRIDIAIVSHPHPDHYLGLVGLDVPIGELWFAPEIDHVPATGLASFAATMAGLVARGTRIVLPPLGVARDQAGVELVTWAPHYQPAAGAPTVLAADPVRTVNDNSLVVAVKFRGRTLLFTGDIEAEGEAALVAAGLGRVDVVKVAHHGSRTSSTPAFVAATRPEIAVISFGRVNQFGFPAASVVARWRGVGADIARTDTDGTVTITVNAGGGIAVDRFVHAPP